MDRVSLIGTNNFDEKKEAIKERLEEVNKTQTIVVSIIFASIGIFLSVCCLIATVNSHGSIGGCLIVVAVCLITFALYVGQTILDGRAYKKKYENIDLKIIEAVTKGNINSVAQDREVLSRGNLNNYIIETKDGEKLVTNNTLIKVIIHSGIPEKSTFSLDTLELMIYL